MGIFGLCLYVITKNWGREWGVIILESHFRDGAIAIWILIVIFNAFLNQITKHFTYTVYCRIESNGFHFYVYSVTLLSMFHIFHFVLNGWCDHNAKLQYNAIY